MLSKCSAFVSEVVSGRAAATAVAIFERNATALPFPRGCTAFVSTMMYVRVVGSIHSEVPVNPVCPKDPTGSKSPRLLEYRESMSHPNPRSTSDVGGCCGVVIFSTVSGDRIVLPSSKAWANLARSSAVENSPACPATPPIRRTVGSWTTPRNILSCSSYCVGAIFGNQDAGGRKRVWVIANGEKMFFWQYSFSGIPDTRSTSAPRTMKLTSLYKKCDPGL